MPIRTIRGPGGCPRPRRVGKELAREAAAEERSPTTRAGPWWRSAPRPCPFLPQDRRRPAAVAGDRPRGPPVSAMTSHARPRTTWCATMRCCSRPASGSGPHACGRAVRVRPGRRTYVTRARRGGIGPWFLRRRDRPQDRRPVGPDRGPCAGCASITPPRPTRRTAARACSCSSAMTAPADRRRGPRRGDHPDRRERGGPENRLRTPLGGRNVYRGRCGPRRWTDAARQSAVRARWARVAEIAARRRERDWPWQGCLRPRRAAALGRRPRPSGSWRRVRGVCFRVGGLLVDRSAPRRWVLATLVAGAIVRPCVRSASVRRSAAPSATTWRRN